MADCDDSPLGASNHATDELTKTLDKKLDDLYSKPAKSLKWKEIIDDDLREMEAGLQRIKLPNSVKSKLDADSYGNGKLEDDELKAIDREIEDLRRPFRPYPRQPPRVFTDSSDEDYESSADVRRSSAVAPKTEISVDEELKALDKEIEALKKPTSIRPKITLQKFDNGVDILEDRKRDNSPIRVERPVAPNYKLLCDSDEETNIDAMLAKRYEEPPNKKPGDTYKCRFCGLTYNYLTTLKAHERVHDVNEPYVCSRCGLSFRYYSELQVHSVEHKGEKGYKCDCGRTFSKYTDLLYHKHPGEDDECAVEERSFGAGDEISAAKVPSYVRGHPDHRIAYYCQFCCKGYATSHDLKYHLYSHRGERRFGIGSSGTRYIVDRD